MVATATEQKIGNIVQVIGSTFDAEFEEGHLPEIYNALKIDEEYKGVKLKLTGEVQQHLGGNRVRCVALGLHRRPVSRHEGDRHRHARAVFPSARRRWAASSTCSASRSMAAARSTPRKRGPSIASRRRSASCPPRPNCSRPASRSSTCSRRSSAAARPACSAGPVWARPSSSRADRPHRQPARRLTPSSPASASAPAKGNDLWLEMQETKIGKHRPLGHHADRHGLRPDERAARRPSARRPVGPDHVRVVPRFDRRRHAAVRR